MSAKKKVILILLTFLLFCTIFLLLVNNVKITSINADELLLQELIRCNPGENLASYRCTVPLVSNYITTHDIGLFFNHLDTVSKNSKDINKVCHSITHSIGRALMQKEGITNALQKCKSTCVDGCSMGVIEQLMGVDTEHVDIDIIIDKIETACINYASSDDILDKIKYTSCVHGIGHGIMPFVEYDTNKGIALCKMLNEKNQSGCIDGVFMEKFLPTNNEYVLAKTDNLYQYCSEYEQITEESRRCFGYLPYMWQSMDIDSSEMLNLCTNTSANRLGCTHGLARIYSQHFIDTKSIAIAVLYKQAPTDMKDSLLYFSLVSIVGQRKELVPNFCNLFTADANCSQEAIRAAKEMGVSL
jgi:hypothetical protein